MRLTTKFQLTSKSKTELKGLFRDVFNHLANPDLSKSERQNAFRLLHLINEQLGMRR